VWVGALAHDALVESAEVVALRIARYDHPAGLHMESVDEGQEPDELADALAPAGSWASAPCSTCRCRRARQTEAVGNDVFACLLNESGLGGGRVLKREACLSVAAGCPGAGVCRASQTVSSHTFLACASMLELARKHYVFCAVP